MMLEDWWVGKLSELADPDQRGDALEEMINQVRRNRVSSAIHRLILGTASVYDCVAMPVEEGSDDAYGQSDDEYGPGGPDYGRSEMAYGLIRSALVQLPVDPANEQLPQILRPAFTHRNPTVRSLVLFAIHQALVPPKNQTNNTPVELPGNALTLLVMDELMQRNSEASGMAISILKILLATRLADETVRCKLLDLLQGGEVVRCRAYELAVALSQINSQMLTGVEFMLDAAVGELHGDDVLLQASVMELLVPLSEQNHGLNYLERRMVFELINERVMHVDMRPLKALVIPSIMKFFGKIATVQPQKIIQGYPHMLACLFEQLYNDGDQALPTAFDTLANLATSTQGKLLLNRYYGGQMLETMQLYSEYTYKLSPHLKERMLHTLEAIFTGDSPNPPPEVVPILMKWFEQFAGGLHLHILMKIVAFPFCEMQVAALGFLKSICSYRFGVVALNRTGGALEFLLSREVTPHKEVKLVKWEIIQVLASSPEFTPSELVRLNAYVNEGPYYVRAQVDVATESNE
ncbi:hypothetical protein KR018_011704 [Drosophila ironensis]|nr:hypothetical protein KR018_011704 [Drosophila ironensis]